MKVILDIEKICDISIQSWSELIPHIEDREFLDTLSEHVINNSKPAKVSKKDLETEFKAELALIRNPNISETTQLRFANHKNKYLRAELATQPHITMYVINCLYKDNYNIVIKNLQTHTPQKRKTTDSNIETNNDFMKNFITHLNERSKMQKNLIKPLP